MSQDEKLLNDLKQAVLDNLENEQFSVEQLAQKIGISRSHLHRKLKKLKGQSISQFIREVRLAEAIELLRRDVATASEIAYKVGFNSPSYFHKCFQEYYGYPPSEAKEKFQIPPFDEETKDKTIANAPIESKPTKKESAVNFKTIAFSIIAFLFLAYSAFYFLKKDTPVRSLEKSIAVLPFNNLSEDESNQHFADGLLEDLLNRLALIKDFKVISRTSSDTYRERGKKKATEIAEELGVSYIVEGSVQKHDNKARITIQLIDAINDEHIWIKTFDKDLVDIFKIQSEIAVHVATELSTILTEQQSIDIQKNQTENVKAFELYQLGRFYWGKRTTEGLKNSINYFEQAIAEDPNYALAYAGIADSYFLMNWQYSDRKEVLKYRNKAEKYALKALTLDDRLVEAHTVLATLYFFLDWDWSNAEKTFLEALDINPNYSTLHHRYAEHLTYTGRHEKARKHINIAIELDPLSYVIRRNSAEQYLGQGQFQEALAEARLSEELGYGNDTPIWYRFEACYYLKDDQGAINALKELKLIYGDSSSLIEVDNDYNASGLDGLIRKGIKYSPWDQGKADSYAILGEYEKALDLLEEAYENGSRLELVPFKYSFKKMASNPRFIALLEKMNLPWNPDSSY